jgi:hypothetical protein
MEREVLAVQKRVLGAEHPATLTTASNLATSLSSQGKRAEAEQMLLHTHTHTHTRPTVFPYASSSPRKIGTLLLGSWWPQEQVQGLRGTSICQHNREEQVRGTSICAHRRQRSTCKDCKRHKQELQAQAAAGVTTLSSESTFDSKREHIL